MMSWADNKQHCHQDTPCNINNFNSKFIIFQFAMKDVKSVSLVDRRGYLTVVLEIEGDAGLVVRKPEGLRDWYNLIQKAVKESKARVMLSTEQFWNKKTEDQTEDWLVTRRTTPGASYHYSDRPASVASVDRRQHRYRHRQFRQQCEYHRRHPDKLITIITIKFLEFQTLIILTRVQPCPNFPRSPSLAVRAWTGIVAARTMEDDP